MLHTRATCFWPGASLKLLLQALSKSAMRNHTLYIAQRHTSARVSAFFHAFYPFRHYMNYFFYFLRSEKNFFFLLNFINFVWSARYTFFNYYRGEKRWYRVISYFLKFESRADKKKSEERANSLNFVFFFFLDNFGLNELFFMKTNIKKN